MENNELEKIFNIGLTKLKNNDFDAAIAIFTELIGQFSMNDNLYANRGFAYKKKGEIEHAFKDFSKAIEINSNNSIAFYNRGNIYIIYEKYLEAISDFTHAIKLESNNSQYYNARGVAYINEHKNSEAVEDFKNAIKFDTQFIDPLFNLLKLNFNEKNFEIALEYSNQIQKLNPDFDEIYYYNCLIYETKDNLQRALFNLNKGIDLDQRNIAYINRRGIIYAKLDDFDNAQVNFENCLKINSRNIAPTLNLGLVSLLQENFQKSVTYFNRVLNFVDNPEIYNTNFFYRGRAHFNLGHYNQATKDFNKAIRLGYTDNDFAIKFYKGLIKFCKKKYQQSEKEISDNTVLEILINLGKNEASLLLDAQMHFEKKNFFFQSTLHKHNIMDVDSQEYNMYKQIYLKGLETIKLLHVNKEHDKTVAHYSQKKTAESLLFANSKFRLSTVLTANDPEEGEVLIDFINLPNSLSKYEFVLEPYIRDHQAFIGSFTFNHDCLNQFRLYGKLDNAEATGVSIVFNSDFFNSYVTDSMHFQSNYKDDSIDENVSKSTSNDEKYALYRCIYIDPLTCQVISIGHREEYTFYRAHNFANELERDLAIIEYNKFIDSQLRKVKDCLKELKALSLLNLRNGNSLSSIVISELLIMLCYLTKHMAFKEEQECRILSIEPLNDNKRILPELNTEIGNMDFSNMYIDYKIVKKHVKTIYFAPKTPGFLIFKDQLKRFNLNINCRQSNHPLT